MNYFPLHIGDYVAATAHLSWDEDMAYTRLIRAYYHSESGIVDGQQYRKARATTAAQRKAVEAILSEFFQIVEGVWVQKRCEQEITRYHEKQSKAVASANARWNKPETHKERSADAMQTHDENDANALRTHCEGNANQEPITNIKPPLPPLTEKPGRATKRSSRLAEDWVLPKAWGEWALANGIPGADAVRMEADKFRDYWVGKAGAGASKADWLATWRNWIRTAASRTPGARQTSSASPQAKPIPVDELYA